MIWVKVRKQTDPLDPNCPWEWWCTCGEGLRSWMHHEDALTSAVEHVRDHHPHTPTPDELADMGRPCTPEDCACKDAPCTYGLSGTAEQAQGARVCPPGATQGPKTGTSESEGLNGSQGRKWEWWKHPQPLGTQCIADIDMDWGLYRNQAMVYAHHGECGSPGWVFFDSPDSCVADNDMSNVRLDGFEVFQQIHDHHQKGARG